MSLDIRYLTNGKKTVYVVTNAGVSPATIQCFDKVDDVPENIRHYCPKDEPTLVGPDMAHIFGVINELYPGFPKCGHPDHNGKRCIAESCRFGDSTYLECPFFDKNYKGG